MGDKSVGTWRRCSSALLVVVADAAVAVIVSSFFAAAAAAAADFLPLDLLLDAGMMEAEAEGGDGANNQLTLNFNVKMNENRVL